MLWGDQLKSIGLEITWYKIFKLLVDQFKQCMVGEKRSKAMEKPDANQGEDSE